MERAAQRFRMDNQVAVALSAKAKHHLMFATMAETSLASATSDEARLLQTLEPHL